MTFGKATVADWARNVLAREFVVFDTETTGFHSDDEIIQIGVIDQAGNTVLETLIKPTKPIENAQYHGITDAVVQNAPGFVDVYPEIKRALDGKIVVAYNFAYDSRMLAQVIAMHQLDSLAFKAGHCAMQQYAIFHGAWDSRHKSYTWQKLHVALAAFGLKHEDFDGAAHDACTDARATLALIQKLAEYKGD